MGRKRSNNLHIRLTDDEDAILKKKSSEANLSVSEYIRLLIANKPSDYPEIRKLMIDLINEYNHIGVNINQIARNNNSSLYNHNDKVRLFAYLQKLNVSVHEVVKALGN